MAYRIPKTMEGVAGLKDLSSGLNTQLEKTNDACDKLKNTFDSVRDAVAHESEIESILVGIAKINADSVTAIQTLSHRVLKTANKLEEFLNGGMGGNGSNP